MINQEEKQKVLRQDNPSKPGGFCLTSTSAKKRGQSSKSF